MAIAKKHHKILWAVGIAGGAFVAYEFVYKPWAAKQTTAGGSTNPLTALLNPSSPAPVNILPSALLPNSSPTPSPLTAISEPATVGPASPYPSTGTPVPGVLGVCMARKNWPQAQCSARLDALVAGVQGAQQWIANYQTSLAQAQAALQAETTALAGAQQAYNAAVANNDAAGAQAYLVAIQGHQQDIADINGRITGSPAQLAAYQAQLAANDNDYFNLTGVHILGA